MLRNWVRLNMSGMGIGHVWQTSLEAGLGTGYDWLTQEKAERPD
jgi:hypothetical protein